MNLNTVERKRALRRRMREERNKFNGEALACFSSRFCEQLRPQAVWRGCRSILSFLPTPGEPDIRRLLEEALTDGKTLALPRFDPARREYGIRQVTSLSDLRPGHFGIPEPGPECPELPLIQLDFLLVPGVAFDASGHRLGRGKGYYDRLLQAARGHKCGVAFDWQLVAEVPVEPHDVCVNSLLTPTRWFCCGA
jgi:5-formyltetrahydrofolate cyclo-ligase